MKNIKTLNVAVLLALGLAPLGAKAGGNLDTFAFTNDLVFDFGFPGFVVENRKIFWDERCASVEYTLDDVPANAFIPAPPIPVEVVRSEIQDSLDQWTAIPTSFIEFNITNIDRVTPGASRGFDFINEITFETPPPFGALASSPSTSLQQDAVFAPGDDIDGDGDPDVYDPAIEGINVCADVDADGDIEFPAGFYAAGTILDNDVQFSSFVTWSTSPGFSGADIQAVAIHEFGHSHGLSHALINRVSDTDGTGSTMFPFIDTGDPFSEIGSRSLHKDDIAWSSLSYPEGGDGPLSSLQPGDIPFDAAYGVLRGTVETDGQGVAGGNVYAVNKATGEIPVGTFSGESTLVSIPGFGLFFRENLSDAVPTGAYQLPLPRGEYEIYLQSPDVAGASGPNINFNAIVGDFFGQVGFDEEGVSPGNQEGAFEDRPGAEQTRVVRPGKRPKAANFVTNESIQLEAFGTPSFIGTSAVFGRSDVIYATRFTNEELLIALDAGASITTALFELNVLDASQLAEVQRVSLTLGRVSEDGLTADIDLDQPLREQTDFIAQDGDFTPVYFTGGNGLGRSLRNTLSKDPTLDVFVVIEMPNDFTPGLSGLPPLLSLNITEPIGNSFLSLEGSPFFLRNSNWSIQLNLTP